MTKYDVYVSEFGNVNVPASPLLVAMRAIADALDKNVSPIQRLIFGKPKNPVQLMINRYYNYIDYSAMIGWQKDKPSWEVDVMSFEAWIRTQ